MENLTHARTVCTRPSLFLEGAWVRGYIYIEIESEHETMPRIFNRTYLPVVTVNSKLKTNIVTCILKIKKIEKFHTILQ